MVRRTSFFEFISPLAFVRNLQARRHKRDQSLHKIRNLSWRQFESYLRETFRQKGYTPVETRKKPGGGADLVLRKDGHMTLVQYRHWRSRKVGVGKVSHLQRAMTADGADHGILVSSGNFTISAIRFGRRHGIKLLGGRHLESFIQAGFVETVNRAMESDDQDAVGG